MARGHRDLVESAQHGRRRSAGGEERVWMMGGQPRFAVLDGMRFIVALGVATFHFTLFAGVPILQRGYLGVDFFFVLSGFIISFAYTDVFVEGGSLTGFLTRRFIRLYPMILFGSIFGSILNVFDANKFSDVLFSMLLIPEFDSFIFPVNVPIWSLFYEALANICFALICRRWVRVTRPIDIDYLWAAGFLACLFANMYYAIATNSLDNGSIASTFVAGFPRAGQSFCAGVLLDRMSGSRRPISSKWLPVLIGSLIACMAAPFFQRWNGLYEMSVITLAFPLIVYFASKARVSPKLTILCGVGGNISYPLYLIHFPVLVIVTNYAYGPIWLIKERVGLILLIVVAASTLIYYVYDRPVRYLLQKML